MSFVGSTPILEWQWMETMPARRPASRTEERQDGLAARSGPIREIWSAPSRKSGTTMRVPGYNSPQRMTFHRLLPWILALLCIPALASSSWDVPAADFARQIAALTGPGTITLSVANRSSLSDEDVLAIRRALERE